MEDISVNKPTHTVKTAGTKQDNTKGADRPMTIERRAEYTEAAPFLKVHHFKAFSCTWFIRNRRVFLLTRHLQTNEWEPCSGSHPVTCGHVDPSLNLQHAFKCPSTFSTMSPHQLHCMSVVTCCSDTPGVEKLVYRSECFLQHFTENPSTSGWRLYNGNVWFGYDSAISKSFSYFITLNYRKAFLLL